GRKVLSEFVEAGAPPEIMYVSKPHIGTFKLVSMVEKMRAKIIALGGEIRFQARVEDFEIERDADGNGRIRAVVLAGGERVPTCYVVLAVGHSARDTFYQLHQRGVYVEAKPFSIGLRVEHPQSLIDTARFGTFAGHPELGAADYKLVHHCRNGRSVYSFCMCPGGTVVAAASEPGRVVTNGMSQFSRNERNANAALVVGITPDDYPGDPLAGIEFQRRWEEAAFKAGGETYAAPTQKVGDFIAGRPSTELGSVVPSYTPGIHLTDLSTCLPEFAIAAIREALVALLALRAVTFIAAAGFAAVHARGYLSREWGVSVSPVPAGLCGSPRSVRRSVRFTPDAGEPALLGAWSPCGPVIVLKLVKPRLRQERSPLLQIVVDAVAPAMPAFFVGSTRVRAE
ncbi:MAG TPA: hypothetical protein VFN52_02160, partial [Acidiferrobacteraceae bacterium]|nr:hypothetical protein [Acidiferrobacteraceae bacterium]